MKEVKCEHCGMWTNGDLEHCNYCNGLLNERTIKEQIELSKQKPAELPLIKIDPNEPWSARFIKSIFRFGQIVFLVIISVLAYMSSSLAHG